MPSPALIESGQSPCSPGTTPRSNAGPPLDQGCSAAPLRGAEAEVGLGA